jgi:uncharacterized protein (DUF983 family)
MKKLIFGIFRPIDLVIFMIGISTTFLLLIVMANIDVDGWYFILALLPAVISIILVMPVKEHHNVLNMLQEHMKK